MPKFFFVLSLVALIGLSACEMEIGDPASSSDLQYDFDFNQASTNWAGGWSDYSTSTQPSDVAIQVQTIPSPLSGYGLYVSGRNNSDDLFLYIKRRITGLQPSSAYTVYFDLQLATNTPAGCVNVGGLPGNNVYVKAGASTVEPITALSGSQYLLQNLDKGNQAAGGANALVLGDLANTATSCDSTAYEYKSYSSAQQGVVATTDADGALWVLFGIDSDYIGTSSVYFRFARVTALLNR